MKFGSVCVAYKEERFVEKHLWHLPDWIDEKILLSSTIPWNGENVDFDNTAKLAKPYATVVENYWKTEADQRNTGQALLSGMDWVIVMDPDEFLDDEGWANLKQYLETTTDEAVVVQGQNTYWKNGYVADPPRDYQMLIAVRPWVPFVDKRIIAGPYGTAPVWLHHFSWARTDEEIWNKISHYAHAHDFDIDHWYNNVWLKWKEGDQDVHPVTPDTLHDLIRVVLPPELEQLNLWPNYDKS